MASYAAKGAARMSFLPANEGFFIQLINLDLNN